MLRAFGRLPDQDWRLRLVGPVDARRGGGGEAYKAELDALAAPFRDRVEWVDFVSGEELVRQHREASIFVYPSVAEKGETFGLAPLEAMALGCATVVSGLECFRDFLVDGETGLTFDHRIPRPEETLCAQLQRLTGDDKLRARLARRGYDTARQFTRERVAALYLEDFGSLL